MNLSWTNLTKRMNIIPIILAFAATLLFGSEANAARREVIGASVVVAYQRGNNCSTGTSPPSKRATPTYHRFAIVDQVIYVYEDDRYLGTYTRRVQSYMGCY